MLLKQLDKREHLLRNKSSKRCVVTFDGFLENYECRKEDEHYIEGQENGTLIPPLACSFSKLNPNILATVDEDGGIIIFNTKKSGLHAVMQDWLGHRNAVFDVEWMPGENQLLTASGDQTIKLWDVATEQILSVFRGHTSSVKVVRFLPSQNAVFATGSRDGHLMIWDRRVQQKDDGYGPVNVIRNAHACPDVTLAGKPLPRSTGKKKQPLTSSQDRQQSVTAVLFQDDNTLISAGSVDGSVKVWDLRKNYSCLKSEAQQKFTFRYAGKSVRTHGYSSLSLDSTGTQLWASCRDSSIYQFDCASYTSSPVAVYNGHKNETFYVKTALSPDDCYLLSGSSDGMAYIWRVDKSPLLRSTTVAQKPSMGLRGHSSEVTGVAWCPQDISRLVTLSDDNTVWFWRLNQWRMHHDGGSDQLGEIVGKAKKQPVAQEKSPTAVGQFCLSHSTSARVPHSVGADALTRDNMQRSFPSPVNLSTSMRNSLMTLPSVLPAPMSSPAKGPLSAMSQWLEKPSPRKLVVTPKKSVPPPSIKSVECVQTVGKLTHSGVKRKLCSSDVGGDEQDSIVALLPDCKTLKADSDAENFPVNPPVLQPPTPPKTDVSPTTRILSAVENSLKQNLAGSSLREDVDEKNLPISDRRFQTVFRSPTVDLPNYVLDPQPRTPIGHRSSPRKTRTPDWLTQIRMTRQQPASPVTPVAESPRGRVATRTQLGRRSESPSPLSSPVEARKLLAHEGMSIRKFLNKSKTDK